jgi:hypothetical protein
MNLSPGWTLRGWEWAGPALCALGVAASVAMIVHNAPDRTLFESGALSVVWAPYRLLPLAGLGLAVGLARFLEGVLGGLLFGLGLVLGFIEQTWLLPAMMRGSATTTHPFLLVESLACLGAGTVLVLPRSFCRWLLPPAAALVGTMTALGIVLADPSFHDPNFPRGGIVAAIWLIAAVGLTGRALDRPWLKIAVRIFASWLIAIGLMLSTAALVQRSGIDKAGAEELLRPEMGRFLSVATSAIRSDVSPPIRPATLI